MASKKETDRQQLQQFKQRFSSYSNEKHLLILHMGFSNKHAAQAINTILKQRGIKP